AVVSSSVPDLVRSLNVLGLETKSSRISGAGSYSERAEVGVLRNTATASGSRCRALIDKWAVLVACRPPRVVVGCNRIGLIRQRNSEGVGSAIRAGDVGLHVPACQRHCCCRMGTGHRQCVAGENVVSRIDG